MKSTNNLYICHWFYIRFSENKVAVAAAALVGGPPHFSHSNFIVADVDISNVLATFFANAERHSLGMFH